MITVHKLYIRHIHPMKKKTNIKKIKSTIKTKPQKAIIVMKCYELPVYGLLLYILEQSEKEIKLYSVLLSAYFV